MRSTEHTVIKKMAEIFEAKAKKVSVTGSSTPSGMEPPTIVKNVMTTIGDMIRGGLGGAPVRIPIGSEGEVLTVVAGKPDWAPAAAVAAGRYQQYVVVSDGSGGFDLVDDGFGNPVFTLEDLE